jgi:hypothetical protein
MVVTRGNPGSVALASQDLSYHSGIVSKFVNRQKWVNATS